MSCPSCLYNPFFEYENPNSDPEDLQTVVVADGDPVRLGGSPLDVIDLSLGCVGQNRVLDGPWHLLDIPDQSLMVIGCGADVTGGVGRPGDAIDTGSVVVQSGHWGAGNTHIQDHHLHPIHSHGSQVVGVLLVPAQSEQRVVLGILIDDGAVLKMAEIKHAH